MSSFSSNFNNSTYSTSNRPLTATLSSDLSSLETAVTDNDSRITTVEGNYIKKDGSVNFTAKQSYSSNLSFSDDKELIAKKYVDDGSYIALPQGFGWNYTISATTATNNLTVALKGLDGNNPSSSNPVYVRVENTVISVTSSLSLTLTALDYWRVSRIVTDDADNHQQLFVYLINNNGTPQLGLSIVPWLTTVESNYYDSSGQTGSTGTDNMVMSETRNATNSCTVIGRINTYINSSYEWDDPTDTTIINRPIHYTDTLVADPDASGKSPLTFTSSSIDCYFRIVNDQLLYQFKVSGTLGGSATSEIYLSPALFPASSDFDDFYSAASLFIDGGVGFNAGIAIWDNSNERFRIIRYDGSNYPTSGNCSIYGNFNYKLS